MRAGHDDGQRAGSVLAIGARGSKGARSPCAHTVRGGHVVGSGVAEVVTVPRMGRARRSSESVERPASLDRSIPFPPMEAELVRELPAGGEWQYEPKWDGFRGLLENASGELRLWSRNARPLLRYFPELQPLGDVLPGRSALDGEIVIVRDGVLDFDAMQTRLHPAESRVRKLSAEIPARFVAFDLLVWDGVEHWQAPLEERRATLERLGTTSRCHQ